MESKLKHLEFIQNVIDRMANTSFLLKGWSITIIAALFAFSSKDGNVAVLWVGFVLTLVFWFLDSYFLHQERLFRALYNHVRTLNPDQIDFSMDNSRFAADQPAYKAPWSATLWPFYLFAAVAQFGYLVALASDRF